MWIMFCAAVTTISAYAGLTSDSLSQTQVFCCGAGAAFWYVNGVNAAVRAYRK
jgi:hypothetical protein